MGTPAWRDPELRALLALLVITLGTGSVLYQVLEGWSLVDAVYFSVVTLATVGYGDISPQSVTGKLFTIAYIVVGIGLVAGFANSIARRWVERRLARVHRARSARAGARAHTRLRRRLTRTDRLRRTRS